MEGNTAEVGLFAVFQVEVRHATHRRCFAFGEILVDTIDPLGNVVERFSKELGASPIWCEHGRHAQARHVLPFASNLIEAVACCF